MLATLCGAPVAHAEGAAIVLLLPAERRAELSEALRLELAGRGLTIVPAAAPTAAALSDRLAAARALADADDDPAGALWLDVDGGPLDPPTVRWVPARGGAVRHARLAQALDVLDPRVFAVAASSLLDEPPPPTATGEHTPPKRARAVSRESIARADADFATQGDRGSAPAPAPAPTTTWVARVTGSAGYLFGSREGLRGGTVGASFFLGRYVGEHVRLEAGFGLQRPFDGVAEMLGTLTLGAAAVARLDRAALELGAAAAVGVADDRTALGVQGHVALTFGAPGGPRGGLGVIVDAFPRLAQDEPTVGLRPSLVIEVPL